MRKVTLHRVHKWAGLMAGLWLAVLGITALIGLIINYIKQDDMNGSWLESHFAWQKNTFWYGLLWVVLGTLTVQLLVGWIVLTVTSFWLIYRIARGWIYLVDGKSMYSNVR